MLQIYDARYARVFLAERKFVFHDGVREFFSLEVIFCDRY